MTTEESPKTPEPEKPDVIVIEGVPGFNGEYPIDLNFNYREHHLVKTIAGVLPAEFDDALRGQDTDVMVALAVIALRRAGRPHWKQAADVIFDAPAGALITYVLNAPPEPEPSDPPSESGGDG